MTDQPRLDDPSTLWKGTAASGWLALQDVLDQVLQPIDDALLGAIAADAGRSVLDVGCGTGGTTVAVAHRLGQKARSTGIDISDQMIGGARARAEQAKIPIDFICGDAQSYAFEPASIDTFVSRFGVMFFDDPVAAFSNLRRAAKEDAQLRFVVWRSCEQNPFMTAAESAAAALLPDLPARQPNQPGQFAMADEERARRVLEESGWSEIDLQPIDISCAMPESALVPYFTQLGPVGRRLQRADHDLRARVVAAVRPAFDSYVHGSEVRFTAACWMIRAQH